MAELKAVLRRVAGDIRHLRRLLRVVPGPQHGLHVRVLRAGRHDPRRGAAREVGPGAGQVEPRAGNDVARRRLRLGRRGGPGGGEVRRQRHRHHAEPPSLRAHQEPGWPQIPTTRHAEARLQGWEEFDEKVDRIVSFEAFDAFKKERWPAFFDRAYEILPDDGGTMLLHSIFTHEQTYWRDHGITVTMSDLRFFRFLATGDLPRRRDVRRSRHHRQRKEQRVLGRPDPIPAAALRADSRTCGRPIWRPIANEAIAIQSQEVYDRFMRYLTGCADLFRKGLSNVAQYTLTK